MVFTGNANPVLAAEIAGHLGISLGAMTVGRFSDGEVTVEVNQNVRARDVFVVQSTCAPTNENLMELLIMVDALKRASAERISAVIPYFGYARQDRRPRSARVPISARVVGVSSIVSCSNAAAIVASSSLRSVRIAATSSGCEKYGSPEARFCSPCAFMA